MRYSIEQLNKERRESLKKMSVRDFIDLYFEGDLDKFKNVLLDKKQYLLDNPSDTITWQESLFYTNKLIEEVEENYWLPGWTQNDSPENLFKRELRERRS